MIPPKSFDIFFPLTGGCSEGSGAFRFFFKYIKCGFRIEAGAERTIIVDILDIIQQVRDGIHLESYGPALTTKTKERQKERASVCQRNQVGLTTSS